MVYSVSIASTLDILLISASGFMDILLTLFIKGKSKKMAAVAQNSEDSDPDNQVTHISEAQYTHIMKVLNSQTNDTGGAEPSLSATTVSSANVAGTCLLSYSNFSWIIDSGATDHIGSNPDLFDTLKEFTQLPNTITIAYGKQVIVHHIGTMKLDHGIILENVLYVPGFKFNLISTHKLCKDLNCQIIFTHDKCLIQGTTSPHSLVLGNLCSGLYVVGDALVTDQQPLVANITQAHPEDAKLWHMRLGNLPFKKLHLLHVCFSSFVGCDTICQICHKAKQRRNSFFLSIILEPSIVLICYM